ncbi:phosphoserine phosphatase SerB [Streptomyces decoyicus]
MPGCAARTSTMLVSVFGRDQPEITGSLFRQLAAFDATVVDVEKMRTRDHITLCAHITTPKADGYVEGRLRAAVREWAVSRELHAEVTPGHGLDDESSYERQRSHVAVVGHPLTARTTAMISAKITGLGGTIERISPLARRPVTAVDFLVSGVDTKVLRTGLSAMAGEVEADLAISEAGLSRRARRLVMMDVDSTLIQDEVIDLFAQHIGCGQKVAAITDAAMRGELDFQESLRARVALLAGLDASVVDKVRAQVRLTPGALTLIRTLQRLGYRVGVVSGGFRQVTDYLAQHLNLDYNAANTLEIQDGRITGRLVGDIVDRAAKARLLAQYARESGVPLAQTVAIGDGANDLDMLNTAGLGVAFNAKPIVRAAAPATLSVPFLDSLLYLLGIPRAEAEVAQSHEVLVAH